MSPSCRNNKQPLEPLTAYELIATEQVPKLLRIVAHHWICVHLVFYPLFEQLCGTAEVSGLLFGRNDGKDELDFIKGPFWQSKTTDVIINP